MDDQLYSRRCDVKKPQLTIGYSAAFTGEEKPRSGVGRAQHSGNLVMHLQIVEVTLLGKCGSGLQNKRPECWMTIRAWGDVTPE